MQEVHDPYAALRYPDYRRLLIGSVLASIAANVQAVAVGWELYERTGSKAALGMVGLVRFLPVLLFALLAGQAADRYSRKGLLLIAQGGAALASLGLLVLSVCEAPFQVMYLCLLLAGIAQAFGAPARWALVPQVVPPGLLGNAVTWNSSGWQIASVVGPALAGLLIWVSRGAAWAYALAATCALACVGLVAPIRPLTELKRGTAVTLASLLAGVEFVWRNKMMLAAITLDLFAVLLGGATALLPIYAKDILKVGPAGLGWLRAAPALGALLMAVVLAHRRPMHRPGVSLLWAVTGFGAATIVFGFSTEFVLSFVMLALTGALDNISVVVRGTLVQVLTPDAMRGRVSAVNAIFISSSNELGEAESGWTAEWFGPVVSVVGGGIGTILVVVGVMLRWPQILRLGPLHAAKLEGTQT